jgi:aconitase A
VCYKLNPYSAVKKDFFHGNKLSYFYSIPALKDERVGKFVGLIMLEFMPYVIRVLLESSMRNCDNFHVTLEDVQKLLNWHESKEENMEMKFKPSQIKMDHDM